jgi:hypothetical protein
MQAAYEGASEVQEICAESWAGVQADLAKQHWVVFL